MTMTPGFMTNYIKPDIVLISIEDDIRLYIIFTNNTHSYYYIIQTSTELTSVN